LVAFGHLNKVRGGRSTVQILTGESETFPTKAEVEEGARSKASHDGKLSHLSCHQVASYTVWSCSLRFVGGVTEVYRGVWYESESRIAFSLAQYKATLHFTIPTGPHWAQKQSETHETGYLEQGLPGTGVASPGEPP
jgi:hypothetical protein